ncbi:acetyl-CoA synthetase-like protein [Aureobasidium subglaciale]|nr:acetyl-CoA synthetase-like protein [Aureobasidium subglaciale]
MAQYGRRLLPNFINQVALDDPCLTFVEIPKSADIKDGLRRITFRDLAKGIDKCAWWIHQKLGRGHDFSTLAYVGPHDLRYLFLVFGACKVGYKMFFPSPRNSTAASFDLLAQVQCNVFLMPSDAPFHSNLLVSVLAERPMLTLSLPELEHFLDFDDGMQPYLWSRTFEDVKNDPIAVFHTSGSTGMPKLTIMNHEVVAALDAFRNIEARTGRAIQTSTYAHKKTLLLFPMFHASALSTLFLSIWNTVPTVLPPPVPLTADLANEMLVNIDIEASIMPPSILAEIAGNHEYLRNLCQCSSVMYGGGPLPTEAGKRIASGTTLITVFGSSETGFFPVEVLDRDDWPYIKLSPCAGGVYRPYADNLCELVIERDPALKEFQPVFSMYPEMEVYHTKDLFAKHPVKPDLWLWQGRIDDIIVLSNGEKFNPTSMEDVIINGHPAVESALICGHGRTQCALLLELSSSQSSDDEKSEEEVVEELWPAVQRANENIPEYGRLMKDMVIVVKQGKRMVRADKGTVQRKRTLERFAAELDKLYRLQEGNAAFYAGTDCPMDLGSVRETVTRIIQGISKYRTIQSSTSFFDIGLDSLHAMTMARKLRTAFLNSPKSITTKVVYELPSIDLLSYYICGLETGQEDSVKTMQILYDRYSPMSRRAMPNETMKAATVLLVGSTGHLGTQILSRLLQREDIALIYCLSRDPDAGIKQKVIGRSRNAAISKHVRHLHANYSQPRFGLCESVWGTLQQEITCVIQNAWPVDLCMPLSHFESSIRLTVELMELCKSAGCEPNFVFISSIGSVLAKAEGQVTEETSHDWLVAETMGYTQSKLVAERLIATTAVATSVKSVICRIGQLGGVSNPELWEDEVPLWPEKEWVPTMLASSVQLGAIPSSLGLLDKIDWLPVDVAAATICELAFAATAVHDACQVYNVINPQTTAWKALLPELKAYIDLKRVSLIDWRKLLKAHIETGLECHVPAAGLLDFFEGACKTEVRKPTVDCSKSLSLSPSLKNAECISVELMDRWIEQWSFSN